jgi:hypothetical protein
MVVQQAYSKHLVIPLRPFNPTPPFVHWAFPLDSFSTESLRGERKFLALENYSFIHGQSAISRKIKFDDLVKSRPSDGCVKSSPAFRGTRRAKPEE